MKSLRRQKMLWKSLVEKFRCSEISTYGHGYGSFFCGDQEDETDRQEVPQEGWLAGEGAAGVEYVLILR